MGSLRTQALSFGRIVTTKDAAGGKAGLLAEVYACLGWVVETKGGRHLEAAQVRLQSALSVTIWANPDYEPLVGDTLTYRGDRYSIQNVNHTDETLRKYTLTVLSQATIS